MLAKNVDYLKKIYTSFFHGDIPRVYLESLSNEINKIFSKEEVNYFKKCLDNNLDINIIEYGLRNNSKNIFSFILLRLSALAESQPENQKMFVNSENKNIFGVLIFFFKITVDFIVLRLKLIKYQTVLKEYPNV